jgi:DNA-directed RNA polymerase subunit beta
MLVGQVATAAPKGVKKGAAIDLETLESVERHEWWKFAVKDDKVAADLEAVKAQYDEAEAVIRRRLEDRIEKLERGDELPPGVSRWSRCSSR